MDKVEHEIIVEEYKALWAYYLRTLDERARIFDFYFKIVSIPFVLTGVVVITLRTLGDFDVAQQAQVIQRLDTIVWGASFFFLLAWLAGVACYIYYVLESANSRAYLLALSAIRNRWREIPALSESIIIDLVRPNIRFAGGLIIHSRGLVLAIFNSAMLAVALAFVIGISAASWFSQNLLWTSLGFALSVAVQYVLAVTFMRLHSRKIRSSNVAARTIERLKNFQTRQPPESNEH